MRSIAEVEQLVCNYYYTADPVSSFDAYLYDLGAMISTERSRTAPDGPGRTVAALRVRSGLTAAVLGAGDDLYLPSAALALLGVSVRLFFTRIGCHDKLRSIRGSNVQARRTG